MEHTLLETGERAWVVALDTEGLGGVEANQTYDARIFSLATLLCSHLVYNRYTCTYSNAFCVLL